MFFPGTKVRLTSQQISRLSFLSFLKMGATFPHSGALQITIYLNNDVSRTYTSRWLFFFFLIIWGLLLLKHLANVQISLLLQLPKDLVFSHIKKTSFSHNIFSLVSGIQELPQQLLKSVSGPQRSDMCLVHEGMGVIKLGQYNQPLMLDFLGIFSRFLCTASDWRGHCLLRTSESKARRNLGYGLFFTH